MVAEKKTAALHEIPDYLIREIIDGQRFYYRGYKDVLSEEKAFDAIACSNTLQAFLSTYVAMVCVKQKLHERYEMLTGSPGLTIDTKNQLVCNTLLFEQTILTPDRISTKYADVVPKLACMIDDKVEVRANLHNFYIRKKIDKLLEFGTEKVIWILTASRQVIVALPDQPWLIYDWNQNIEIVDSVFFNIGEYLKKNGARLPE